MQCSLSCTSHIQCCYTLSREVQELYEGSLPFSYLTTECHCSPSHPVINIDDETQCIQHSGGSLINRGASDRINPLAHPPGFINDLNVADGNGWITSPGGHQANITLNLTNSLYEVCYISWEESLNMFYFISCS